MPFGLILYFNKSSCDYSVDFATSYGFPGTIEAMRLNKLV